MKLVIHNTKHKFKTSYMIIQDLKLDRYWYDTNIEFSKKNNLTKQFLVVY